MVPLWRSVEDVRRTLPAQTRPVVAEALCCGMTTEAYGDRALGIEVTYQAGSDIKVAAQRYTLRNNTPLHFFTQADDLTTNPEHAMPPCLRCKGPCQGKYHRVDLVRSGLPCQPFSKHRTQSRTQDLGAPHEHSKWQTVWGTFFDYLEHRRPGGFIVEEVLGFANRDPRTGEPYAVFFMQRASDLGFFLAAACRWTPPHGST